MNRKSNRNIVDIILDIMEGGPRPMKNLKVTEKNRNCVDHFWDAHQAEYEARENMSRHALESVNQHNLAYPRLGDELDKRKSLSKVKTNLQKNDISKRSYDSACAACMNLRGMKQLQKYTKPCNKRKMKSKTRSRDIKSRVRKNRYNNQKRIKTRLPKTISVNRMMKCHCCYVRVKHKRVGNDMSTILNVEQKSSKKSDDIPNEKMSSSSRKANGRPQEPMNSKEKINNVLLNEELKDLNIEKEKSRSSIKTLKNPDTSVASISSYNSYASLDHEPMVNMEL